MKKRLMLLGAILILLPAWVNPAAAQVQTQAGIAVTQSSARVNFPAGITFGLGAQSDANIVDVRLNYHIEHTAFARVYNEVALQFVPAASVELNWDLSMLRAGGLPAGSSLEYWWKISDAAGGQLETRPETVRFDDDRYAWASVAEGMVTLHWYRGNDSFARELMSAAQDALARMAQSTGAELARPANIYIYGSQEDLLGSMIYRPGEWTGGVAFPRYSTIAIGIAPSNLDWGKRAIAHELSHLIIGQVTLNPYNSIPPWLDEGLAMYIEGPLEAGFSAAMGQAISQNRLISVQSLSSPFSALTGEAILSYAESYSLVSYLIRTYGQDKMLELLETFRQGSTYDEALLKVYGFDMDGLNALWLESINAS